MISDITVISQITLPGKSDESTEPESETNQVFLGVAIMEDGQYQILKLEDRAPLHVNITSVDELQFILKTLNDQHRVQGKALHLLIEPAPASHMQKLVDVLDVCERLAIPKNINTEAVFKAAE